MKVVKAIKLKQKSSTDIASIPIGLQQRKYESQQFKSNQVLNVQQYFTSEISHFHRILNEHAVYVLKTNPLHAFGIM